MKSKTYELGCDSALTISESREIFHATVEDRGQRTGWNLVSTISGAKVHGYKIEIWAIKDMKTIRAMRKALDWMEKRIKERA